MPLVLAIEPDPQQAEAVRRAVGHLAGVDLIVVDRMEAAAAALRDGVPHLILMSALLSPADESALTTMLRTRPDAAHVQIMTIPRLETTRDERGRGFFGMFSRRKEREENELRCDPRVFAAQIRTHLDEVREALANAPPPPIDWSGFRDSVGERAAALDADGRAVELLRAGNEFSGTEEVLREVLHGAQPATSQGTLLGLMECDVRARTLTLRPSPNALHAVPSQRATPLTVICPVLS